MKKILVAMALVVVMLAMLVMAGCGGDDAPVVDDAGEVVNNNVGSNAPSAGNAVVDTPAATPSNPPAAENAVEDIPMPEDDSTETSGLSKEDVADLIKETVADTNSDWELLSYYDEEEDEYYLFIISDLTDADCEYISSSQWEELSVEFDSVSESCQGVYQSCGYDIPCTVVLMSQEESILLISTNGVNTFTIG